MPCIRYEEDEAERRKRAIETNGQPVRTSIAVLNDRLLVIKLEALEGFVHLVQDPEACIEAFGQYHISVCQLDLITDTELAELRNIWDGMILLLPFTAVRSEGFMEIGDCALIQDPLITRLHHDPCAWYANRPLHVSG